jgi:hypothetical protein
MDNRLGRFFDQRPSHLRREDLPEVATAITAYLRGFSVTVGPVDVAGVRRMVLRGPTFNVAVLWDDWAKIDPYIRDDTFSSIKHPTIVGYTFFNPLVSLDPATVGQDPLYRRVLDVLTLLFPDTYPRAKY